jgi:hypothetical protein
VFAVDSHTAQSFGDGTFIGMEPMPGYHDPDTPKDRWFYQNTLTIKGSNATLNKIPVSYYKGRKSYSASDGGFYTYRGTVSFADGKWHIVFLLVDSDYVPVPVGKDGKPIPSTPRQFTIERVKDRSLRVDKVIYRTSKQKSSTPNQTMQRTLRWPTAHFMSVCHSPLACVDSCSGLAVADLWSR